MDHWDGRVCRQGRDGVIRKAIIKYCNSSEQKLSLDKGNKNGSTLPRCTERAVRKLVKIFSLEETSLADDMAELDKRVSNRFGAVSDEPCELGKDTESFGGPAAGTRSKLKCQVCCCGEHCEFKLHFPAWVKLERIYRYDECGS